MSEELIFLLIIAPFVIVACFGGCHLVSKYTDMGMLEPLVAIVLSVPLLIIGAYQLWGRSDKSTSAMLRETIVSLLDFEHMSLYTICSMILVLLCVTGMVCVMILVLVFTFYGICAIFAKSCMGTLVKKEKPEGKRAEFAFYRVDSKVYQCAVAGVSKKLVVGNEYKVRLNKLQQKVYDKATIPTCMAGLFMFALMVSMSLIIVVMM